MTVEMPDQYGGKPIPEDAIEIALAAEKKKKDGGRVNEEEETQGKAQGEAPSLEGFIYVRSVDLYFAKEISHLGIDWYDTHRELHKQNLRMPTIPEFVEFLKYLRADLEHKQIYDEITEVRNPWRAEWLDAKFHRKGNKLWVAYNHIVDSNDNLVAQENEKLEGHLMQDKCPGISLEYWLNNPTKQGLPPEDAKQGDFWYWYPRDGTVARFFTASHGTYLNGSADPGESSSEIGVFACAEKLGEKQ